MNRTKLPLSEIKVTDRFRKDYGDLTFLKDSITRHGLIQPVVVNQDKVLVAGGRRYTAHVELGLDAIDVVYKETLAESERQELEALENIARKNFSWQEETLAVARIHREHVREANLGGPRWDTRLSCELFGISKGALGYVLEVAKRLEAELSLPPEKRKFHLYQSCFEAYRLGVLGEIADAGLQYLKTKHQSLANTTALASKQSKPIDLPPVDLSFEKQRYERNPHNKIPFEQYWKERKTVEQVVKEAQNVVHLTNRILHCNCIEWMNDNPDSIDHILTDIPYGIDMEMLDQLNLHGGMQDLETVEAEHEVDSNMDLMKAFFPAAFRCTHAKAFVITYLDIMQWQYCYNLACEAGFKVQRWPLIWHKQSGGMNNCAAYNTTKNYDILMLCRKPGTTLIRPITSSILLASHEEARRDCGHIFSKPYAVTNTLANAIANKGSLFLEPFAGRGSIAIELMRQEFRVIATEIQEGHYNALLENTKRFYLKLNPNTVFQ